VFKFWSSFLVILPRIETGGQFMVERVMWLIVHLRYIWPYNVHGRVAGEGRDLGGNDCHLIDVLSWCVLEGKEQNFKDLVAIVHSRHYKQQPRECSPDPSSVQCSYRLLTAVMLLLFRLRNIALPEHEYAYCTYNSSLWIKWRCLRFHRVNIVLSPFCVSLWHELKQSFRPGYMKFARNRS
jgi:hypothetical protein